jgi:hypothetical protein
MRRVFSSQPNYAAGMDDTELASVVRARLAESEAPGVVFGDLLVGGTEPRVAAVAVCVAGGTDRSIAEVRLGAYDDLWPLTAAGDEHAVGDVLEQHGYFDHEPVLDEEQTHVLNLLRAAIAAVPGWPSGYAIGLFRSLRLAHFARAVVLMERLGEQRWATDRDYWIMLSRAADAVTGDTHEEFVEARDRCRHRAGQVGA